MIVNAVKNSIMIFNEEKTTMLNASLNFERVVDTEDVTGTVGIMPIFSIYVSMLDVTEEGKKRYQEFYKELLSTISMLFPEVYYLNTFEASEKIYCLRESMIDSGSPVKVPYNTNLKIYKD